MDLNTHRLVRVDIDNHLRTSSSISRSVAKRAVDTASKRLGPGGVLGILNYNPNSYEADPRWDRFVATVPYDTPPTLNGVYIPEKDLLVVRGQEVPSEEGHDIHLVGVCETPFFANGTPLDMLLHQADTSGVWKGIAAPFHKGGLGATLRKNPSLATRFDGIETFSGEAAASFGLFPRANEKARELFFSLREEAPYLAAYVGTDGHSVGEVGLCWQKIPMPQEYSMFAREPEKLVSALREGFKSSTLHESPSSQAESTTGAYKHAADLILSVAVQKLSRGRITPDLVGRFI